MSKLTQEERDRIRDRLRRLEGWRVDSQRTLEFSLTEKEFETLVPLLTDLPRLLEALDAAEARIEALEQACAGHENEIEQTLGKALGYPEYPEPGSGWVCVGEHVAATLAMEAANKIGKLEAEAGRLRTALEIYADELRWVWFANLNCWGYVSPVAIHLPGPWMVAREALDGEQEGEE